MATTYWSFGALWWSCTCTSRSLRFSSFSSLRVATTLPTTLPISIRAPVDQGVRTARSGRVEDRGHARARQHLVQESLAQLAVHVRGHGIPRRSAASLAEPE